MFHNTLVIYEIGSKSKVTRALTGVRISRANEIPCLGTTDDHSNKMPSADGACSAVKLRNLR